MRHGGEAVESVTPPRRRLGFTSESAARPRTERHVRCMSSMDVGNSNMCLPFRPLSTEPALSIVQTSEYVYDTVIIAKIYCTQIIASFI
jgi:hypothetical protein